MSDEPDDYGMTAEGQITYTLPEPGPLGKHAGSWAVKGDGLPDLDYYDGLLHGIPIRIESHAADIPGFRMGPFENPNELMKAYGVNIALIIHSNVADYVRFLRMRSSMYGVTVRYIGNHENTRIRDV